MQLLISSLKRTLIYIIICVHLKEDDMAITFNLNAKKAIEAIVYLANKKPSMTQYFFMKMIFYADKFHINKYGTPVIGDRYIKMANGPVPSFVLDAIHKDGSKLTHDDYEEIEKSLSFRKWGRKIYTTAKRKADMDYFSDTDIECLDAAFDFCKDKNFDELKNITHDEPSWKNAIDNRQMDYALFIDENNPDKKAIIADLSDNFGSLVL